MAKKKNNHGPAPVPVEVLEDLNSGILATYAEERRKVSGDELKASLRQQRRESRLAEKGY